MPIITSIKLLDQQKKQKMPRQPLWSLSLWHVGEKV